MTSLAPRSAAGALAQTAGRAAPGPAWRRRAAAAAKVAVSAGLVAWVLGEAGLGEVAARLTSLPLGAGAAAAALMAAVTGIIALRWWLVMRALGAPLSGAQAARFTFTGIFFNQVLPTSFGGDGVRMWQATRAGVPVRAAVTGVALERAGGFIGLAVMVALGLMLMGARIEPAGLRLALAAVLPATLLGAGAFLGLSRLPAEWRRYAAMREAAALAADARKVLLRPVAVPLLALSLAAYLCAGGAMFAIAQGLGLSLGLPEAVALMPMVILATLIPVSFAGWGLREGACVALFAGAGVAADGALAASVLFGILTLIAALPGAALWRDARPRAPSAERAQ